MWKHALELERDGDILGAIAVMQLLCKSPHNFVAMSAAARIGWLKCALHDNGWSLSDLAQIRIWD